MRALLLIALIFSCDQLEAAEERAVNSCAITWLPAAETQLEWVEIDHHMGALALGDEIVARIAFTPEGPVLRDRLHPDTDISDTRPLFVAPDLTFESAINIRLSPLCELSLRGIARNASRKDLVLQADAWQQIGNSLSALVSDDREIAAKDASSAFKLISRASRKGDSVLLEIAAFAIERHLDAGEDEQARDVFQLTNSLASFNLTPEHPSKLKFELARARLLSFSNASKQALDLRRFLQIDIVATFGHQSEESLLNQIRIANLELEMGNIADARAALETLAECANSVLGSVDSAAILATTSLANALALQGFDHEGLNLLIELGESVNAKVGKDDRRFISIEDQIARIKIRIGELESALDDASKVFLWRKRRFGFANVETLESAWILGRLYKDMGRFVTARALINAILEQLDSITPFAARYLKPKALGTLGSIEAGEGNLEVAATIWRGVADSYSVMLGNDSSDALSAFMNFALLSILNNQASLVCSEEGLSNFTLNEGTQRDRHLQAFAKILDGLCSLTFSKWINRSTAGVAAIENGWHEFQVLDGDGGDSTMYALSLLALVNLELGNRSLSKNYLHLLIGLAETGRARAGLGSLVRDAWFSKWVAERNSIVGYRTLALLHAEDGELEEALRIAELARDRRLNDRSSGDYELKKILPTEVYERFIELSNRINRFDENIALTSEIVGRVEIESERVLAINELDRLKRGYEKYCKCSAFENSSKTSALQLKYLAPDTAIVSIQHTEEKWWGILLRRGQSSRLLRFDSIKNLKEVAQAWLTLLSGQPIRAWPMVDGGVVLGFTRPIDAVGRQYLSKEELGERLGRALLKPIVEASPESHHYVIVADDELAAVPFGALPIGGNPAIRRFAFTYAPSLKTYFRHSSRTKEAYWDGDLFAMAANRVAPSGYVGAKSDSPARRDDRIAVSVDYVAQHPLDFAQREVERIASMFHPGRVKALYGPRATKEALVNASREGSLRRFRYAHFAAHSVSFPDAPERSTIFIEQRHGTDGFAYGLTAAELSNLEMNSELVVLSACSTAAGRFEPGQGMLGLAFAALAAGNHAAVLTLWQIPDDLTEEFMVRMYRFLREGIAPDGALSATQRDFASSPNPRKRDPATWAAFVLYGSR